MKLLKPAIFAIVLAVCQYGQAQVIDRLRTFYTQENMNMVPALFYDSVASISVINDTTKFMIIRTRTDPDRISMDTFWQTGDKVYDLSGILFYDYSLEQNDTFYFENKWSGETDQLFVDSVYLDTFANRILKVWSLKDSKQYPFRVKWIEGIGSMDYGWDYSFYNGAWTDGPPETVAICVNDTMLFWDDKDRIVIQKKVEPNCNYKAIIRKLVSIGKRDVLPVTVNLYPVPANGILNIELGKAYSGRIEICNALGQVLLTDDFESGMHLTYKLPEGNNGILYVKMISPGFTIVRSFNNQ
jgi:hypothetical protein